MERTANIGLLKPDGDERLDLETLNANADRIDAEVAARAKPEDIKEVPFARNLVADDAQQMSGEFLFRSTGGDASLSDGEARLISIMGRMEHTGYAEEQLNLSVTMAGRTDSEEEISAEINRDTFVAYVNDSTTITLNYTDAWSANPSLYGITISGTPKSGDKITVTYVKGSRGVITPAAPTAFKSTGWNLFNPATGYARVKKYGGGTTAQHRISGTYTSVQFSTTLSGSKTAVTVLNGNFNINQDGYIWVNGSGDDTAVIMTWTDWTNGYPGEYQSYTEDTIDISGVMTSYFPYGLCSVGGVSDEINLDSGKAISRIARQAYSDAAMAQIKESGRLYEADENYIYSVRSSYESHDIEIDGAFDAYDHGTEIIVGGTVAVYVTTLYGQNLRDKLRTDVLTISQQTLTESQKTQIRNRLGVTNEIDGINAKFYTTNINDAINFGTIVGGEVLEKHAYRNGNIIHLTIQFRFTVAITAGSYIRIPMILADSSLYPVFRTEGGGANNENIQLIDILPEAPELTFYVAKDRTVGQTYWITIMYMCVG